ncbi:hypothetical protein ACSTIX_24190, partial [Vibrio parahaemolyticus]
AHEIIDVRDMRQHVVGGDQVCSTMALAQPLAKCHAKKFLDDRNAPGTRGVSRAGGGLHAQSGDALLLHVLQEIPIIGGQFDHQGLRVQL